MSELPELSELLTQLRIYRSRPLSAADAGGALAHLESLAMRVRSALESSPAPPLGPSPLSPREKQILAAAARGWLNKQIAHELRISERTVQAHLQSVFRKLEVASRTEAAVKALKNGWLS